MFLLLDWNNVSISRAHVVYPLLSQIFSQYSQMPLPASVLPPVHCTDFGCKRLFKKEKGFQHVTVEAPMVSADDWLLSMVGWIGLSEWVYGWMDGWMMDGWIYG